MSNFWNNFTAGFCNGPFGNPFSYANFSYPFSFGGYNSVFGGFGGFGFYQHFCPNNFFMYPNVMSTSMFSPLLPETNIPQPIVPNFNVHEYFMDTFKHMGAPARTELPQTNKTTNDSETGKDKTKEENRDKIDKNENKEKIEHKKKRKIRSFYINETSVQEKKNNNSPNVEHKKKIKSFEVDSQRELMEKPKIQNYNAQTLKSKWSKINPKLDTDFYQKVIDISKDINCNPTDLLGMMNSESTLNPQSVNSRSNATGLIQFMPKTAKGLGTSITELRQMDAIEQLDYVREYFLTNKKVAFSDNARLNAGDLYALCFLPGYARNEVLCKKTVGKVVSKTHKYYQENIGLDTNGDGEITKTELANRVKLKTIV